MILCQCLFHSKGFGKTPKSNPPAALCFETASGRPGTKGDQWTPLSYYTPRFCLMWSGMHEDTLGKSGKSYQLLFFNDKDESSYEFSLFKISWISRLPSGGFSRRYHQRLEATYFPQTRLLPGWNIALSPYGPFIRWFRRRGGCAAHANLSASKSDFWSYWEGGVSERIRCIPVFES